MSRVGVGVGNGVGNGVNQVLSSHKPGSCRWRLLVLWAQRPGRRESVSDSSSECVRASTTSEEGAFLLRCCDVTATRNFEENLTASLQFLILSPFHRGVRALVCVHASVSALLRLSNVSRRTQPRSERNLFASGPIPHVFKTHFVS